MSKFLWFLGGCATGLLAAAAISVLSESSSSSSSSYDDDEEADSENDDLPDDEAPIFPVQNFKATSAIFAKAYPHDCGNSDAGHITQEGPDCPENQNSPA